LLLGFSLSCQKEAEVEEAAPAISVEQVKSNAQREVNEAWNGGNADVLDEFTAADFVYHLPPQPDIVGLEAYKDFIKENHGAYPDLKLTIKKIIVEGNSGAMWWTYEGTQTGGSPTLGIPATGKHVVFSGIALFRVNDEGKTVETWNYVDWVGLMTQLGFTITPPVIEEEPEEIK
jgi:steroid delta-isomerase-like uncharacterized protein